jgi:hypothetical protein
MYDPVPVSLQGKNKTACHRQFQITQSSSYIDRAPFLIDSFGEEVTREGGGGD